LFGSDDCKARLRTAAIKKTCSEVFGGRNWTFAVVLATQIFVAPLRWLILFFLGWPLAIVFLFLFSALPAASFLCGKIYICGSMSNHHHDLFLPFRILKMNSHNETQQLICTFVYISFH